MLPSQENYTNVPYRQEDKRGLPLQYTLQYWVLLSFVIFANLIGISLVMSMLLLLASTGATRYFTTGAK